MSRTALVTAIPAPVEDLAGDERWMSQHRRFVRQTQSSNPKVLFVGDSIIHQLQDTPTWLELFDPLGSLNFGIGGDTTQTLLWRLMDGELEMIKPEVIVLMIGTNNFLSTAEDTFEGIRAVVDFICKLQPQAQLLVLELLPRGERPNPQRVRIEEVNNLMRASFGMFLGVRIVNIDPGFVGSDGLINHLDMPDYLHLSNNAYKKAFEPLYDVIVSSLAVVEAHNLVK